MTYSEHKQKAKEILETHHRDQWTDKAFEYFRGGNEHFVAIFEHNGSPAHDSNVIACLMHAWKWI